MHRTTFTFSENLIRKAKVRAASEGLSLSDVVRRLLARWVAGELRLDSEPPREALIRTALGSFGMWRDRDPDRFLAESRAGLDRRDGETKDARMGS
jgi:plasmid stability protein